MNEPMMKELKETLETACDLMEYLTLREIEKLGTTQINAKWLLDIRSSVLVFYNAISKILEKNND